MKYKYKILPCNNEICTTLQVQWSLPESHHTQLKHSIQPDQAFLHLICCLPREMGYIPWKLKKNKLQLQFTKTGKEKGMEKRMEKFSPQNFTFCWPKFRALKKTAKICLTASTLATKSVSSYLAITYSSFHYLHQKRIQYIKSNLETRRLKCQSRKARK